MKRDIQKQNEEKLCFELAEFFKIFSDSTRIRILNLLKRQELSVGDIAEELKMHQSAISHQLRILKQSRLVKVRREGKNSFYSLDDEHIEIILQYGIDHINERGK
ncbi:MAG TPA: metalloregulator ArsR/SmtB family transcription factor [Spirochaetota bacterium]|jgi:ArsR family transcriptional regulator|nr:winged helix-turn-helix transcriptional regulator [Spirochaetota bacterium]OQA95852.1 MAG: hypothetical protein BWY23_02258 [Spirochaetes bacterium ADurb.Bin218]HOK01649.1 metalloregulator ArsR/SmtB family transcription factor [Spirochaetota bacterium]HOK91800.1 metalloregulator ArsR/SmtB family transcription factor [Spirochaetota bacterium]HON15174.1 metalloregulator ArsR/SmtB family transcription factor [Spirochaetota bacterium]